MYPLHVRAWRQLDIVRDMKVTWNENPVNGDMIGMVVDLVEIWIIFIICHAICRRVVTLDELAWPTATN